MTLHDTQLTGTTGRHPGRCDPALKRHFPAGDKTPSLYVGGETSMVMV
jgi:hypothetical protein